ncbi:N-acetylmuramoyl-L-alanine amidase [Clostridium sporogenes]|uniref:cell wall-binding repeat-containing protein n=1 Tax=Clostridium botulinum TaxID=1491 RepID=UPI0007178D33|nr:cell wall-binding repeat-containing protein [Clostridium botulinum]KRU30090.1 N-acetylmuramoyl-L-alanine amidase [Clostridium sporogenes]KRU31671.1 N-acetylmuramoyl-L-alanine amidase [Clostridium sporogenes]KRU33495.1 N-acetylmuramoyl-L-alanine amidase [Clostridium sporogenes]KRU36478.1 N-acetylmuramoyl-L-alanine amidase [Clostridium sporogenes]MBZ1328884.1 cell wall-binding repeat-containing protein [Clostridium botulinum]
MLKNKKWNKSFFVLLAISLAFITNFNNVKANDEINFKRLYGKGRYETSASICSSGWQTSEYAIIASGEGFADALSAAPLAQKYNAPILLTGKNKLNDNAKAQLEKLETKEVIIIGGPGSISEEIVTELKDMGINVDRIYGEDRYKTSLKIAEKIGVKNGVVVTNGLGFADALAMAPIAASKQMPILLTPSDKLTNDTMEFLNKNSYDKSYVLGGTATVSDNIKNSLKNPIRLSGDDRYKTNIAILNHFKQDLNLNEVYITSGNGYADALSGSALASKNKAPIILMNESINKSTQDFVNDNKSNFKNVTIFGGEGAVKEFSVNNLFGTFKPGEIISDTQKVSAENEYIKDYDIDLPQKGKLDIDYDINNFRHFYLTILDNKGNEVVERSKIYSNRYEKLHDDYNDIRLPKGKYKVRVRFYDMDGTYTIKTKYTPEGEGFEEEFNDRLEDANLISPNKEITGSIYEHDDVDYYKFTLNEKGSLQLNLKHNQSKAYGFNIKLLNENNEEIKDLDSHGDDINSYSSKVRLPKGTYFVKVQYELGTYFYGSAQYKFNLIYTAENENYETEPNDYVENANYIQCNKEYTGNIQSYNDRDYYKVHLNSDSKIRINFKHNQSNQCWRIHLYDKDNKEIKEIYSYGDEINKTFDPIELKSGDYYILVENGDYSINYLDYTINVLN